MARPWSAWLIRHKYLAAGVLVAVVMAAIIAVPLSLGETIGAGSASQQSEVPAQKSVGAPTASSSRAAVPAPAGSSSYGANSSSGAVDILQGRKIVRRANVQLSVQDVQTVYQEVLQLVTQSGGYAVSSSLTNVTGQSSASLEVQVPVADLSDFLASVSRLGHVDSTGQSGSDVTQQVVDVNARLQVLQAEESQLVKFLQQAKTVGDMLKVEQQLEGTRTQIEELQAQEKTLSTEVAMATIDVAIRAAAPSIASQAGRQGFAAQLWQVLTVGWDTLTYVLGRLVLAVAWLLPFAAVGGLAYGAWRALKRLRERRRQEPRQP
ncbi:MAG: DUF4349 domain-containing protein [Thermaerobacter sp.]|nr:DUF4349 domain-containing protein [Thermaerobacter sp.]